MGHTRRHLKCRSAVVRSDIRSRSHPACSTSRFGVRGRPFVTAVNRLPATVRIAFPALAVVPYCLVTQSAGEFRWSFAVLYAILPVMLVVLLWYAGKLDPRAAR